MKYENINWGAVFAFIAVAWPAIHLFRNSYTPTQVILGTLFSYLGVRLCYFVYFKKN